MQQKRAKFRSALALMLAFSGALAADEDVTVQTELIAEVREAARTGGERDTVRLVPATVLSQGQVVYYTVRIVNRSPVYARNVAVIQRIPSNTSYVPGSASGPAARVSFSTDGGQTFAQPGTLASTDRKGQRAQPDEYTHIRWELSYALAPGAVALARFQATFQ